MARREARAPREIEFADVLKLRYQVLDRPLGLDEKVEKSKNDIDPNNINMAAFDGDKLVTTVRFDRLDRDTFLVRRMATAEDYQGKGYGAAAFLAAEQEALNRGAQNVVLHARLGAVGFYEKMGYTLTGNSEYHDGDENLEMVKGLK